MRRVLTLFLAPCIYVTAYFALVHRGLGLANCGYVGYFPAYSYGAGNQWNGVGPAFRPIHWIDRRLRPAMWEEQQNLAAILNAAPTSTPASSAGSPNKTATPDGGRSFCLPNQAHCSAAS